MKCSICGFAIAWCVDKDEKGTYWLCGECAASQVMETFLEKQALLRVARAADDAWPFMFEDVPKALNSKRAKYEKLYDALKEVEDLLK